MNEKRYFQWLVGEDAGNVETLNYIKYENGQYYMTFTSGESVAMDFIAKQTNDATTLRGKVMVEIQDPMDKWTYKEVKPRRELLTDENGGETMYEIPPIEDIASADLTGEGGIVQNSVVGKKHYIAPRWRGKMKPLPEPDDYPSPESKIERKIESLKQHEAPVPEKYEAPAAARKIEEISESTPVNRGITHEDIQRIKEENIMTNDPVYILVNSSAKEEKIVDLTLKIALPSKELYKIICTQFDGGAQKFSNCIMQILKNSLADKGIVEKLRDSIIQAYEN